MAVAPSHHDFESTAISGNATVQQGDRQIINTFHITHGYIVLQDELDLPEFMLNLSSKRERERECEEVDDESIRAKRTKRIRTGQGSRDTSKLSVLSRSASGKRRHENEIDDYGDAHHVSKRPRSRTLQSVSEARCGTLSTQKSIQEGTSKLAAARDGTMLRRIYQSLPRLLFESASNSSQCSSAPYDLVATSHSERESRAAERVLMPQHGMRSVMQDLATIFLATLSYLACDNGGINKVKCLVKRRDDRLHLLGAFIFFGIARFLLLPQIAKGISEYSGDCIILMDASCFRRLCAHGSL